MTRAVSHLHMRPYVVIRGDSLYDIAKAHNVRTIDVLQANGMTWVRIIVPEAPFCLSH